MAFVVKKDEAFDPVDIGLFSANTVIDTIKVYSVSWPDD